MELKQAIRQAVKDGYTTFITGMAYGVDIWAGEIVADLKKRNKDIRLIAAVPFDGFESGWDDDWKNRYHKLLEKADEVHFICDGYFRAAYQRRNEWMVDRSSRVIAVYNGEPGGTRNTINYAEKHQVPVIRLDG
jgi:uncharacterized phage-like protein YoqJ